MGTGRLAALSRSARAPPPSLGTRARRSRLHYPQRLPRPQFQETVDGHHDRGDVEAMEEVAADEDGKVRFLVVGDWGTGGDTDDGHRQTSAVVDHHALAGALTPPRPHSPRPFRSSFSSPSFPSTRILNFQPLFLMSLLPFRLFFFLFFSLFPRSRLAWARGSFDWALTHWQRWPRPCRQ